MKNSILYISFVTAIAFVILSSCQADETTPIVIPPDAVFTPTAYEIERPPQFPPFQSLIPANNPMTVEGIELGRFLFYEKKLSVNNEVSCGSCHKQKLAFADNGAKSITAAGIETQRNSPTLTNLLWQTKFFFDGRASTIEEVIEDALENEQLFDFENTKPELENAAFPMYDSLYAKAFGTFGITEERTVFAIAQFLRTMVSANSRFDRYWRYIEPWQLSTEEFEGLRIFLGNENIDTVTGVNIGGADCLHCHGSPEFFTDFRILNNALDSAQSAFDFDDLGEGEITGNSNDNGKFKAPTLRNIMLTAPYMHDGRFADMDAVLNHYNDGLKFSPTVSPEMKLDIKTGGGVNLSADSLNKMLLFMEALTDDEFINNPAFSDPF